MRAVVAAVMSVSLSILLLPTLIGMAEAGSFALQRDTWYKFGWNVDYEPWNGTAGCPGPNTCELIDDESAQSPENMPWRVDIDGPGGRIEVGDTLTTGSPLEAIAIVADPEPGIYLDPLYYYSSNYRGDNQAYLKPGTYYLWLVPIPDQAGVATFRWVTATAPEPATTWLAALGLGAVAWRARRARRNRKARAEIAFHDFPLPAGERCAHPWRSASACPTRDRRQPPRI